MEEGEGPEYRLYRYCVRVQDVDRVWRKMPRHGRELGRLLGLVTSARGWTRS